MTHPGRVEVINAICRAACLGQLGSDGLAEARADWSADFASGHLRQADMLWAAVNVLRKQGIDLETVRMEVEKPVGRGPDQKIFGNIP